MKARLFSVIVPVRNRPEEIVRCVRACYAQTLSPSEYEVLVVDNGSTDLTGREAARAGARVIDEPEPGRSRARNTGAGVARGQWLAFTDSDCEPEPGWLEGLAEAATKLEHEKLWRSVGALAGEVVSAPATNSVEGYIDERRWLDQEKFLTPGRPYSPPFAATANLCIRKAVFEEVGGFDPGLEPGEDADWCWRAADVNRFVRLVPDARVVHHHRSDIRGMMRQAYEYGIANALLFARHRERWAAEDWHEPERYVWALKGLAKAPLTLIAERDRLRRPFAFYDFLTNLAQARGRREGGRRAGVRVR